MVRCNTGWSRFATRTTGGWCAVTRGGHALPPVQQEDGALQHGVDSLCHPNNRRMVRCYTVWSRFATRTTGGWCAATRGGLALPPEQQEDGALLHGVVSLCHPYDRRMVRCNTGWTRFATRTTGGWCAVTRGSLALPPVQQEDGALLHGVVTLCHPYNRRMVRCYTGWSRLAIRTTGGWCAVTRGGLALPPVQQEDGAL